MIENIREWLSSIVFTALFVSAVIALVPEGGFRRIARFTGGLIFLLAVFRGVGRIDPACLAADVGNYRVEIEEKQTEFEKENETLMLQSIEEDTETYILDKAAKLGLALSAEVSAAREESGAYYLTGVRLAGDYNAEFADWIEETLGLGAEQQEWGSG